MNAAASRREYRDHHFAEALGWFSIVLGVSELVIPGGLARLIGVKGHRGLFRFLGLRELSSGLGILARPRQPGWVWSRVAGDAMDLALLGAALTSPKSKQNRVIAAGTAVAGVAVLDYLCGQKLSQNGNLNGRSHSHPASAGRTVFYRKTVIIEKPAAELFQFWRNFENLPRFMCHLESVQVMDSTRSHWKAKGPAGMKVEWDAEITSERPSEMIAWQSLSGDVPNRGNVRFIPARGGRGTIVTVELEYEPPAGKIGMAMAKLFREEPGMQIQDALRFFKQLMETGEIATTRGQPAGRAHGTSKKFDYPTPAPALSGSPA